MSPWIPTILTVVGMTVSGVEGLMKVQSSYDAILTKLDNHEKALTEMAGQLKTVTVLVTGHDNAINETKKEVTEMHKELKNVRTPLEEKHLGH